MSRTPSAGKFEDDLPRIVRETERKQNKRPVLIYAPAKISWIRGVRLAGGSLDGPTGPRQKASHLARMCALDGRQKVKPAFTSSGRCRAGGRGTNMAETHELWEVLPSKHGIESYSIFFVRYMDASSGLQYTISRTATLQ